MDDYNPRRPWQRRPRTDGVNPVTVVWVTILGTITATITLAVLASVLAYGCGRAMYDGVKSVEIGPPAKAAPNAKR